MRGTEWITEMMMEMVLVMVMMVMKRPPPTPRRRGDDDGGDFPPLRSSGAAGSDPPSERIKSSAAATASDNSGKIRTSLFGEEEGVGKKPHARRCSRAYLVGPTQPGTWAAWAHPIWPSWPSCLRSSFLHPSPDEKLAWYFSFNYLSSRNS